MAERQLLMHIKKGDCEKFDQTVAKIMKSNTIKESLKKNVNNLKSTQSELLLKDWIMGGFKNVSKNSSDSLSMLKTICIKNDTSGGGVGKTMALLAVPLTLHAAAKAVKKNKKTLGELAAPANKLVGGKKGGSYGKEIISVAVPLALTAAHRAVKQNKKSVASVTAPVNKIVGGKKNKK